MSSSITIAPHLQRALEVMSKDMAVEPQALVNQAVFAWLRINGYVLPGNAPQVEAPAAPVELPVVAPAVAPVAVPVGSSPTPAPVVPVEPPPAPVVPVAPVAAPVASALAGALARMAEIDADLGKLARPWPAWTPAPPEDEEEEEQEEEAAAAPAADDEPEEEAAAAVAAKGDEEEPSLDANTGESEIDEPPSDSTIVLRSMPIALYLEREGEEPIRVTSDRFIIGRGPHCDLVIDSPRVSREHVALTRSGILYFIEDLNSSNGTWFGEERVTKRELESGDVINLGNEPVTFFLRGE